MSIPVEVKNIIWNKSEASHDARQILVRDAFIESDDYTGSAEDYLPTIIREILEEECGDIPVRFEWRYTLATPVEWFSEAA